MALMFALILNWEIEMLGLFSGLQTTNPSGLRPGPGSSTMQR
jgi:hypothetical protein